MAWHILITDSVQHDLGRLDDPQEALSELFDWATNGPPCDGRRALGPASIYEDVLKNGIRVRYFIGTSPNAYVAVLTIRKPPKPPTS